MHHRRALCGIALALVLALPATASADPPTPSVPLSAFDEHALVVRQNAMRRKVAVVRFVQTVQFQQAVAYAAALEQARADEAQQARVAAAVEHYSDAPAPTDAGSGRCGGDLPPCYVMQRESGGNIRAENPVSTASGKWQFVDGTWNNYGGYAHAADAPEWVQDAKARETWAGGAGCSHWSAC